jgi:hypothetical protein
MDQAKHLNIVSFSCKFDTMSKQRNSRRGNTLTVMFSLSWSTFSSRTSEKYKYDPSRRSRPTVISLVIGSMVCRRCVLHFGRVRLRVTSGASIEKGKEVQAGLNLSDITMFSLRRLAPRSVSSATKK